MQKCIEGANDNQRKRLVDEVISHTRELVRDQYANYVLQLVLERKDIETNSRIGKELIEPLLELGRIFRRLY